MNQRRISAVLLCLVLAGSVILWRESRNNDELRFELAGETYCVTIDGEQFSIARHDPSQGTSPCANPWSDDIPPVGYSAASTGNLWLVDQLPMTTTVGNVTVIRTQAGSEFVGTPPLVAEFQVVLGKTPVDLLFIDNRPCRVAECTFGISTPAGVSDVRIGEVEERGGVTATEYEISADFSGG